MQNKKKSTFDEEKKASIENSKVSKTAINNKKKRLDYNQQHMCQPPYPTFIMYTKKIRKKKKKVNKTGEIKKNQSNKKKKRTPKKRRKDQKRSKKKRKTRELTHQFQKV